jgi:hypothetical protein
MEENNIFNRLYNHEVAPPEGLWESIAAKLEEAEEEKAFVPTPVVQMNTPARTNWLKMALAASVLGFVVMTALWFNQRKAKPEATEPAIVKETTTIHDTTYITLPNATLPNNNVATINENSNNTKITKPTIAENSNTQPIKNVAINKNKQPNEVVVPKEQIQLPASKKEDIAIEKVKQGEIRLKDENGNPIKSIDVVKSTDINNTAGPASKPDKTITSILNKISLAGDKEEIDNIIENSPFWKKQIQEWRTKLIQSGYAPSLINMMDILELKKIIDEKK